MRSALVWVLLVAGCGDNLIGNFAPLLSGTTLEVPEDTPTTFTIVTEDLEGDPVTLSASKPEHGMVTIDGDKLTFTPSPNYNGPDSVLVTASDGISASNVTFDVVVTPVNDPPVGRADSIAANANTPTTVALASLLMNDNDVDGDTLSVISVGNSAHGSVVIAGTGATFTPTANFSGMASFEYVLSDGSTAVTVPVTVMVAMATNTPPVAVDDTATGTEDTDVSIVATTLVVNDTDAQAQALTVTAVANPTHGTVALVTGTITFTPEANYSGDATFEYTVSDGAATDTGMVTIALDAVNDAPVAGADSGATDSETPIDIPLAMLLSNDTDVDSATLTITEVRNPSNGTAVLGATAVTFTPTSGFNGTATFEYVVSDGTLTAVGLVSIGVTLVTDCGDGVIAGNEACDDGNEDPGDGCSAACAIETGYACTGQPSSCAPVCGDTMIVGDETCDDGNTINDDGCTSQCRIGAVCTAVALPGGDRFAVDPLTGHCYASFDDDQTTEANAEAACVAAGGHLVTITSTAEDALVHTVQNPAQNPWIGAVDDANDTDDVFAWVTGEAFGFKHFAPGQPDDDAGDGGNGECLHLFNADSEWNDTNCDIATFVVGRICEIEAAPCGDHVLQTSQDEECDDGNTTAGDGCSATCQLETGCGNGTVDGTEECDDDNVVGGDGCSATCLLELQSIAVAPGPGPLGLQQQQRVQLKATGTYFGGVLRDVTALATWSSTDSAVATAVAGRVDAGTSVGSSTITATLDGKSATSSVDVGATTCNLKINEIQVAGDGTSAAADEFAELVNSCTFAIDMTGWTLVYRAATGTSDITATTVNLTGTVQPGEFRLYAGTGYNGGGTPDGTIGNQPTGSYAAAGGGMAIRAGAQNVGAIVDSIGYGSSTNAYIEGTVAPAPGANKSLSRSVFDGRDAGVSSTDFVVADTPTPRATNTP